MTIAYLAHPVGERDLPNDAVQYGDNMAGSHDWISFLAIVAPDLVLECSWIALNTALSPRFHGGRMATSAYEILRACAVLILTGGMVSPHMRQLVAWAKEYGIPILDLVDLGFHPPWRTLDQARTEIARRLAEIGL